MTHPLPPQTFVVVGRRLGRIVKPAQIGGASGYTVTTTPEIHEGYAPHFVAEHSLEIAELGRNVCRTRRGECFCGLVHVTVPELDDLHRAVPIESVRPCRFCGGPLEDDDPDYCSDQCSKAAATTGDQE